MIDIPVDVDYLPLILHLFFSFFFSRMIKIDKNKGKKKQTKREIKTQYNYQTDEYTRL